MPQQIERNEISIRVKSRWSLGLSCQMRAPVRTRGKCGASSSVNISRLLCSSGTCPTEDSSPGASVASIILVSLSVLLGLSLCCLFLLQVQRNTITHIKSTAPTEPPTAPPMVGPRLGLGEGEGFEGDADEEPGKAKEVWLPVGSAVGEVERIVDDDKDSTAEEG